MSEAVLSPCIKVCTLDASGQLCLGCFRTLDEIGQWAQLSNAARARIVEELQERRRRYELGTLSRCENCGAEFECGAGDDSTACWCAAYPPVAPSGPDARCLCPLCLAAAFAA